jgi:hypothetical protein
MTPRDPREKAKEAQWGLRKRALKLRFSMKDNYFTERTDRADFPSSLSLVQVATSVCYAMTRLRRRHDVKIGRFAA